MEEIEDDRKPKIDMVFIEEQMAYDFYNAYAGKVGFSIRVEYRNYDKSVKNTKIVTNSRFVCGRAGYRKNDKRDYKVKNPRPEIRIGCTARLGVRLNRELGMYIIYEFKEEHNHELAPPETRHMLKSQRKVPEAQAEHIDIAANSGIGVGASFEMLGRLVGRRDALSFLKIDHKNYLRTKRQRELGNGEHGWILKYLQGKVLDNPSFFYAFQLDNESHITNIFWADAQMRIDYSYFGDVVSFDTTYKINNAHRPCAAFVGFNHHRKSTVFGAALLYDETADTFRWLFDTFLAAMANKHSKSIFTDQDAAMAKAITECMPNTFHGLCIWHLSQNALKNVPHGKVDDRGVHSILNHFYYDVEIEEDFESLWDMMVDDYKLHDNNWVKYAYSGRRKWAFAFIRDQWTARIRSTQLSESFNSKLKLYLKSDYDMSQFFHHFDRVLADLRYNELEREFSLSQTCPRVKGPVRMLNAASKTYTKIIFEEFQEEYYRSLDSIIKGQGIVKDDGSVEFTIEYETEVRKVLKDNVGKLSCSCKLFERQGILCSHALKVLREVMNLLELPGEYILSRWTRKAKALGITDSSTPTMKPDCKIDRTNRMRDLLSRYNLILTRASECLETYEEALKNANELAVKVEKIISNKLVGNDDKEVDNDGVNNENGNTGLVDCAGVKGIKRKKDPFPKRKKRFVGRFEKTMAKARKKKEAQGNQDAITKSSQPTSNIGPEILYEVPVPTIREQTENSFDETLGSLGHEGFDNNSQTVTSIQDDIFSYAKLLRSDGVIDLDMLGL